MTADEIIEQVVDAMFERELCDMMKPADRWPAIIKYNRDAKTQLYLECHWNASTAVHHLARKGYIREGVIA